MPADVGTKNLTASGYVVGAAATRVYSIIIKSGSGGAASPTLNNGSAGTEFDLISGTQSQATIRSYPGGMLLTSGAYVTFDGNTSYATVLYALE